MRCLSGVIEQPVKYDTGMKSLAIHMIHPSWISAITLPKSRVPTSRHMPYCGGISHRNGPSMDPCDGLIRKDIN